MPEVLTDKTTADLLYASVLSLRSDVVPALSTPEARLNADLITRILMRLYRRFSQGAEDLQTVIDADEAIHSGIRSQPQSKAESWEPAFSAIERLEQRRLRVEDGLAMLIPELLKKAKASPPEGAEALMALERILESQRAFMASQDPDILKGSYVVYQGGRFDECIKPRVNAGTALTEETLTNRLQTRFPGCAVSDLSLIPGGFSKTTAFFTLTHADGEREALVLRKDLPVEFVSSVAYEFPLLQRLHQSGFPVAEPLWLEDDPSIFGGRFLVSRRAAGSIDFRQWAGDESAVRSFAGQLAKLMADLHALEPAQFGYRDDRDQGKSAGDCLLQEIERWHRMLREERLEPLLLAELTLQWLKANVPSTVFNRAARLVHGDIGFHNMMIDRGKVSALLDWEFSHLADPLEDLVYTKPFIEKVMDWEEFKSFYYEHGGVRCTAEEESFYTIWSKIRVSIPSVRCASIFTRHLPDELKFAAAGFCLGRYLQLDAAEQVMQTLSGHARNGVEP